MTRNPTGKLLGNVFLLGKNALPPSCLRVGSHLENLRKDMAAQQSGQTGKAWGFHDLTELPQNCNYLL
jgi:hypothetical protein